MDKDIDISASSIGSTYTCPIKIRIAERFPSKRINEIRSKE